jgi:Protein affecting phage T7 exclusion by the F plasmid
MLFVRAEGRHTLRRVQGNLAKGELPTDQMIDGGLLIAAGAFLLTPGLVTDAVGFLIALPLTRIPIRLVLKRYVITPALDKRTSGFATGGVYTAGFPGETGPGEGDGGSAGPGSPGPGPRGGDGGGGDGTTVNLDPDEYDVSVNEDRSE